jgi:hypothetical protein
MIHSRMRPRSFGEILDGAFQIYRSHVAKLALTTLAPGLATAIATILLVSPEKPNMLVALVFFPISMLLMVLLWGALTWEASEAWLGAEVKVGEAFRVSGRSFLRLCATMILMAILFYVMMIPVGIVAAVVIGVTAAGAGASGAGAAASTALIVIGVILFVGMMLVGVLAGGWMACAVPLVVIEGVNPLRALGRSLELVRGSVLRSGLLVVVSWLIVALPMLGVMLLTGQFSAILNPGGTPPTTTTIIVQQLGGLAVSAFTTPFMVAVMVVLYYDRRVRTEALDVEMVAHDLSPEADPATV